MEELDYDKIVKVQKLYRRKFINNWLENLIDSLGEIIMGCKKGGKKPVKK